MKVPTSDLAKGRLAALLPVVLPEGRSSKNGRELQRICRCLCSSYGWDPQSIEFGENGLQGTLPLWKALGTCGYRTERPAEDTNLDLSHIHSAA